MFNVKSFKYYKESDERIAKREQYENQKFNDYLQDVKSQLTCNEKDDEDKGKFVTYDYTDKQIDENLEYFKKCMKSNLSAYKALLFFSDHLLGNIKF